MGRPTRADLTAAIRELVPGAAVDLWHNTATRADQVRLSAYVEQGVSVAFGAADHPEALQQLLEDAIERLRADGIQALGLEAHIREQRAAARLEALEWVAREIDGMVTEKVPGPYPDRLVLVYGRRGPSALTIRAHIQAAIDGRG